MVHATRVEVFPMRAALASLVPALLLASACGGSLYAPCDSQLGCADGLRCVNVGGDYGALCTRPCTVTKSRAGFPDALDESAFFEDGTTHDETVADSACAEGSVKVTSQDQDGPQQIGVEGEIVGVCRVSPEQIASNQIAGNSVLSGWCTPL